ncbi:MAG TPA: undecaprenyldiphospho-muramoylpentapeptide beta-N-acetylglucosaminyltransferase [Burkholderiales bacterium]|nr:undecaprenyldiphospho-muramoylpentapeptide beta-N-acetylglucosaminyltransferase [Burkholderiales bacterium]
MSKTILIMAGGTGGHVMPALAVAKYLSEQGWRIVWLGVPGSMEADLVPKHGYEMAWVRFSGVRGKGLLTKLMLPWNLLVAFAQCAKILRSLRPNVVLGMGGYVTFPGGMMAVLFGRPLIVHEQNAVAGLANRVLALVADKVLVAFPNVLPKSEFVGNPVRDEILNVAPPALRFAGRSGPLRMLVVGGSLGAQALNEVVPQALALLTDDKRPTVLHQSGKRNIDGLKSHYTEARVDADAVAFIDDMAGAYADADVVICRAGAMTIAELAAVGVASVLVPFPYAVDDHQSVNARYLTDVGAAVMIQQQDLGAVRLASVLLEFTREKLLLMAERARAMAKPEATRVVAEACAAHAKERA